jgi:IS5 family transposase
MNIFISLHEPGVYVIAKGKDHKQYEYGNKVSIVSTKDTNIIVGVAGSIAARLLHSLRFLSR